MAGLQEGIGLSATAKGHVVAVLLEECDETSHSVIETKALVSLKVNNDVQQDLFKHLQFQ